MRILASAALAMFLTSGAFAADLEGRFDRSDQIREILSEGVKEYRAGRYEEASLRFQKAIDLEPDNQLIYDFYLKVGPVGLMQMQQREELSDIIDGVLGRARIYQRELRQSAEYHEKLIDKLAGSEEDRLVATYELVAAGPRAIPSLVKRLHDSRQDDMRVWCRIALTRMGYRAVRPLVAALSSDDMTLVKTVATLLTDIADARALPQLQHLAATSEDETIRRVAENAVAGIARAAGIANVDTAPVLYFAEALRYFRDGSDVRDEMVSNESLLWRWDTGANELKWAAAPEYSWNELVAEELLFEASAKFPSYAGYQPLLAAVLAAQDVEANLRLRLAKERIIPARSPEEESAAIEARVAALDEAADRVKMTGAANLCHAINQCIVAERYNVATYLMRLLQDPWLAWPNDILPLQSEGLTGSRPGSVLAAALEHGEKTIRYQAAITLAHLDPGIDFFNADKVLPLLSEAVGEWGMKVVLVVDSDYRYRNAAARELMAKGFLVVTAQDGFEAMVRLREAPIKDAIVIAGDLTPAVRDAHGEIIDVPEQTAPTLVEKISTIERLSEVPVFVSLPEDAGLSVDIQNAFNGKVKGFLAKPFNGSEMADAIDGALGDDHLPEFNRDTREEVSLAAAEALAGIDPVHSQFDVADPALLQSLASTVEARGDEIRIAALNALGHFGARQYAERIAEIYLDQDAELSVPVRIAFLGAIGLLDPSSEAARQILGDALQHADREVRRAASQAVGRARSMSHVQRHAFEVQQRLDAREAGNGLD